MDAFECCLRARDVQNVKKSDRACQFGAGVDDEEARSALISDPKRK